MLEQLKKHLYATLQKRLGSQVDAFEGTARGRMVTRFVHPGKDGVTHAMFVYWPIPGQDMNFEVATVTRRGKDSSGMNPKLMQTETYPARRFLQGPGKVDWSLLVSLFRDELEKGHDAHVVTYESEDHLGEGVVMKNPPRTFGDAKKVRAKDGGFFIIQKVDTKGAPTSGMAAMDPWHMYQQRQDGTVIDWGTHPSDKGALKFAKSHGIIESEDHLSEATGEAAKGPKVTIYHKGRGGNILRSEGTLASIWEMPSGSNVGYIPRGSKKEDMVMSYYSPFWMVVEGWGHPKPEGLYDPGEGQTEVGVAPHWGPFSIGSVSTGRSRRMSTDPAWVTNFYNGLFEKLRAKIIAVYKDGRLAIVKKSLVPEINPYQDGGVSEATEAKLNLVLSQINEGKGAPIPSTMQQKKAIAQRLIRAITSDATLKTNGVKTTKIATAPSRGTLPDQASFHAIVGFSGDRGSDGGGWSDGLHAAQKEIESLIKGMGFKDWGGWESKWDKGGIRIGIGWDNDAKNLPDVRRSGLKEPFVFFVYVTSPE